MGGVAAINAITFGVYGNVLRRMEDPANVTSVMTAGAAAGLIQVSGGGHIVGPIKSHLAVLTKIVAI